jgi:hypothetical protein
MALKAQLVVINELNKMTDHQDKRRSSLNCPHPPRRNGMAKLKQMLASSSQSQDFFTGIGSAAVAHTL